MNSLSHLLTDTLDTGVVDYLTPDNTAVTDVHQLQPLAIPVGRRRKLLAATTLPGAMVGTLAASTRLLCMHARQPACASGCLQPATCFCCMVPSVARSRGRDPRE